MKKNIYILIAITLFFIQCEKDNDPIIYKAYVVAGDTISTSSYILNKSTDDLDDGKSTPSRDPHSSSYFKTSPVNIDNDKNFDIRFGSINYLVNDYLINRALFVSNNYENEAKIEFAVIESVTKRMNNDTIPIAILFNQGDTISHDLHWVQSLNPEEINSFYFISYYYDFENHKRLVKDYIGSEDLKINNSFSKKYIGIRKKINEQYVYGWISCSVENHEILRIIKCAFAD